MENQKLILSICPLPHIMLVNFEIRALKCTPKPNLRLIQLKLGKLEFLGVTIHVHKHDNDMEKNVDDAIIFSGM